MSQIKELTTQAAFQFARKFIDSNFAERDNMLREIVKRERLYASDKSDEENPWRGVCKLFISHAVFFRTALAVLSPYIAEHNKPMYEESTKSSWDEARVKVGISVTKFQTEMKAKRLVMAAVSRGDISESAGQKLFSELIND